MIWGETQSSPLVCVCLCALCCRASTGACDLPEVCNGKNATCPADVKALDNTVCPLKKDL